MRAKFAIILIVIFQILSNLVLAQDKPKTAYQNITPEEVKARLEKGEKLFLLDVRTPEEYNGPLGHIEGSKLIPLQELDKKYTELDSLKDKEIIVYCRSGNRSRFASLFLAEKGFKVKNMLGGMKAWNRLKEKK